MVAQLPILSRAFSGLVPVEQVRQALVDLTDLDDAAEFAKKLEAARKYDNQTAERRNYWGELAVWSERRLGVLLLEAKASGTISQAGSGRGNKGEKSSATMAQLLGIESETKARHISSRAQKIAQVPEEKIAAAIESIKESGDEVSKAAVRKIATGAHVGQNSGDNEWYTPEPYIKAARKVMGGIDLDPASHEDAQKIVKARRFFTAETNGLESEWCSAGKSIRVWMNPPYAQPLIGKFAEKFSLMVTAKVISQGIVLVNNATETEWSQRLAVVCSAVCMIKGRVKFWHPEKESAPLQGQLIWYAGESNAAFVREFSMFGPCYVGGMAG